MADAASGGQAAEGVPSMSEYGTVIVWSRGDAAFTDNRYSRSHRCFLVDSYRDEAIGVLAKNPSGKLAMTRVTHHATNQRDDNTIVGTAQIVANWAEPLGSRRTVTMVIALSGARPRYSPDLERWHGSLHATSPPGDP
jgi:hypothetical protein